jgi:hypothetical protein
MESGPALHGVLFTLNTARRRAIVAEPNRCRCAIGERSREGGYIEGRYIERGYIEERCATPTKSIDLTFQMIYKLPQCD